MTYETKSNIKLLTVFLVVWTGIVGCIAVTNMMASLTDAAWVVQEASNN